MAGPLLHGTSCSISPRPHAAETSGKHCEVLSETSLPGSAGSVLTREAKGSCLAARWRRGLQCVLSSLVLRK